MPNVFKACRDFIGSYLKISANKAGKWDDELLVKFWETVKNPHSVIHYWWIQGVQQFNITDLTHTHIHIKLTGCIWGRLSGSVWLSSWGCTSAERPIVARHRTSAPGRNAPKPHRYNSTAKTESKVILKSRFWACELHFHLSVEQLKHQGIPAERKSTVFNLCGFLQRHTVSSPSWRTRKHNNGEPWLAFLLSGYFTWLIIKGGEAFYYVRQ